MMRTKGAVILPYLALGGLVFLLADGWFKLQRLQKSTETSVMEIAGLLPERKQLGAYRTERFDQERRSQAKERVDAVGLGLALDHDFSEPVAQKNCQQYILYYKPPKTGSTAVTYAARKYIHTQGHADYRCGLYSCGLYAEGVCDRRYPPKQLLGHLEANFSTIECLRESNYYVVTSNRDPLERWNSAYRYNYQHQASHYGIPWNSTYPDFIRDFPPCVLLNYYDGQGRQCKGDTDARIRNIVKMVDEVIDLYSNDNNGDLYHKSKQFLAEDNVSDVGNSTLEYPPLSPELNAKLDPERKLYYALKLKGAEPLPEGRKLCVSKLEEPESEIDF